MKRAHAEVGGQRHRFAPALQRAFCIQRRPTQTDLRKEGERPRFATSVPPRPAELETLRGRRHALLNPTSLKVRLAKEQEGERVLGRPDEDGLLDTLLKQRQGLANSSGKSVGVAKAGEQHTAQR